MSRIPKQFIDELLARIDIVDIINARVALKKSGANYVACCPFHTEKTPSFSVSQSKQFYHCFGCSAHGTAISFLMEYDRLNFPEAIETLAHSLGIEVPREGGEHEQKEDFTPLFKVLDHADSIFRQRLKESPEAIKYLKNRGLSGETVARFGIGYAPQGWENFASQLDPQQQQFAVSAGLTNRRESGGLYDRFRHRIMFPIHDRRGRVVGFGGRVISAEDEPKYLNSPETPLFQKGRELYGLYHARQAHRQLTQILVVEGYMDVVMLAEHGIDFAVATLGTATTSEHLRNLIRAAADVIFCFDGDSAGQKAAWRAFDTSLSELDDRHQIRFLFLPDGEDPDSLIQKEGAERFQQRIQDALPLSAYFLKQLKERFDSTSLEGKAQLAEFARPLIKKIKAGVLQELIAGEISQLVGIRPDKLLGESKTSIPVPKPEQKIRGPKLEMNDIRLAVAALLSQPALAKKVESTEQLAQLKQAGIPLLLDLIEQLAARPELTTAQVLERYRDTPESGALRKLAAYELPNPEQESDLLEKVFLDALHQLRRKATEQRYAELLAKPAAELTASEKKEIQAFGHR